MTLNNIALWQSGDMGEKCNKKVVNFGNWFLCQFSPKTYKFLHGAFLTPQELEDNFFEKKWHARGKKSKKTWRGCFSQLKWVPKNCFDEIYDICFLNICEKHPLIGENCIQSAMCIEKNEENVQKRKCPPGLLFWGTVPPWFGVFTNNKNDP